MAKVASKTREKDIILLCGITSSENFKRITDFRDIQEKTKGRSYRFLVLHDKYRLSDSLKERLSFADFIEKVNFESPVSISKCLKKYEKELKAAVVSGGEANVARFKNVVPHLAYLKVPTSRSLEWSTNKIEMRRHFKSYDKNITPKFSIVKDSSKKTLDKIEKKVGYPLIIKPVNLASSLLVTIAYHREELESELKTVFRKIKKSYAESDRKEEPKVLVEQFMDGREYSIDCYVNTKGKVYYCPIVGIKAARDMGVDDFFHYRRITPTKLPKVEIEAAEMVCYKAIHALSLKNTTVHIELMKMDDGWKVVELGARMGGYRHQMYELSYDIDHASNSLLVALGKKPKVKKTAKGYTAAFEIFAKKEGKIKSIRGVKAIQELESVHSINVRSKVGDRAKFAKHGGKRVLQVIMFNESRSKLLADIRRMEKQLQIKVK